MFIISKIIGFLITPIVVVLALLILSLIAAWAGYRRLSLWTGIPALVITIIVSVTPLAEFAVRTLENRYPQRQGIDLDTVAGAIILGGAQSSSNLVAERGRYLVNDNAERLITILELRRKRPDIAIVVTGGSGTIAKTVLNEGDVNRLFFKAVGIDESSIIIEERSRNTFENAALTAPLLPQDDRPWLLVTSASHMPRSVMIFEDRGIDIVPYPVDYTAEKPGWSLNRINVAGRFNILAEAIREYVGIAYFAVLQRS